MDREDNQINKFNGSCRKSDHVSELEESEADKKTLKRTNIIPTEKKVLPVKFEYKHSIMNSGAIKTDFRSAGCEKIVAKNANRRATHTVFFWEKKIQNKVGITIT